MTIQLTSPVLRMTKPTVIVPLPRQVSTDARDAAMFNLENNVVSLNAGASFRDQNMPLELIESISSYLSGFPHPYDHKCFIMTANELGLSDPSYFKLRNLMLLTPVNAISSGGIEMAFQIMNGLAAWGIRTDNAVVFGEQAIQAAALMHVATTILNLDDNDDLLVTYYTGISRAKLLNDSELVDLVKDYPECHRLISETIQGRQEADAGLLREMLSTGSLAVSEGQL